MCAEMCTKGCSAPTEVQARPGDVIVIVERKTHKRTPTNTGHARFSIPKHTKMPSEHTIPDQITRIALWARIEEDPPPHWGGHPMPVNTHRQAAPVQGRSGARGFHTSSPGRRQIKRNRKKRSFYPSSTIFPRPAIDENMKCALTLPYIALHTRCL